MQRQMSIPHAQAPASQSAKSVRKVIKLPVKPLTSDLFRPFGQVVSATPDGKEFDQEDADLQLDKGKPRFYIMRIPRRGLKFDRITFHQQVTQCLGGLSPSPWYLTVAAPSGSVDRYPKKEDLMAFRIPHGSFVKLHAGTWHAGPLFDNTDHMDFYNLELSDTNIVDHNTHVYSKTDGFEFELVDNAL